MNRKWTLLLGIAVVPLVLEACAGRPFIFDENLPLEESARLFFMSGVEVTEYNGIPIPHKTLKGNPFSAAWRVMYLPPGEMEFTLDLFSRRFNTIYTGENLFFKYKFDAGKTYTIDFTPWGGPEESQWGIEIYDSPPKAMPKSEDIIAFVPFSRR
jgi:hypothetical protein